MAANLESSFFTESSDSSLFTLYKNQKIGDFYQNKFLELKIDENPLYPRNDIGVSKLFLDIHHEIISFVKETNTWFIFKDMYWQEDKKGYIVSELCKNFALAYAKFAETCEGYTANNVPFYKYAADFHKYRRRESILADARSIALKSLAAFDRNPLLINCKNGTYNLDKMIFTNPNPADKITKTTKFKYFEDAACPRWESFIDEIMCGNKDNIRFLQKALGYALTGNTSQECMFVLYGPTTRNGKSTLVETIAYLLGDYAMTMNPRTLARRNTSSSAPSPDIARLKGVRFLIMPEPEKGLELDAALVKQFTGGESAVSRFLYKNISEFKPEFKLFINTNHLPKISDNTVFQSNRIKVIPFDRYFSPEEQDTGLKKLFCEPENLSGIFSWLLDGYRMFAKEGLELSEKVHAATEEYQTDMQAETEGFFEGFLMPSANFRLKTSEIYQRYVSWTTGNGNNSLSAQDFVGELRHRYEVKRDKNKGNVVIGFELKPEGDT